jgi:hypothetical protein
MVDLRARGRSEPPREEGHLEAIGELDYKTL